MNTYGVSLSPKELQDLLDELEASRRSRKRAWENLQEMRWALKDAAGVELPPPARKTIDLEGRVVKDGVRKTVTERQAALNDLVKAIREFRMIAIGQVLPVRVRVSSQSLGGLDLRTSPAGPSTTRDRLPSELPPEGNSLENKIRLTSLLAIVLFVTGWLLCGLLYCVTIGLSAKGN